MVTKTVGGMLYCPKIDQLQEFRYHESLKKNVMILTKPPNEFLETQSSKFPERSKKVQKMNLTNQQLSGIWYMIRIIL
jgi:Na+/H+ antiporter NhaB